MPSRLYTTKMLKRPKKRENFYISFSSLYTFQIDSVLLLAVETHKNKNIYFSVWYLRLGCEWESKKWRESGIGGWNKNFIFMFFPLLLLFWFYSMYNIQHKKKKKKKKLKIIQQQPLTNIRCIIYSTQDFLYWAASTAVVSAQIHSQKSLELACVLVVHKKKYSTFFWTVFYHRSLFTMTCDRIDGIVEITKNNSTIERISQSESANCDFNQIAFV